jgi:hypothetical protein
VRLEEVLLSGNRFTLVPPVLYKLPTLTAIVASDCRIERIDVDGVAALAKLNCLDLSNNAIATVPPELGLHPSLKKVRTHLVYLVLCLSVCYTQVTHTHTHHTHTHNHHQQQQQHLQTQLELFGNTFRTPRPAILAKGTPAVLEYLRDRLS